LHLTFEAPDLLIESDFGQDIPELLFQILSKRVKVVLDSADEYKGGLWDNSYASS